MAGLLVEPGDTVTVVDNTRDAGPPAAVPSGVRLLAASERQSSYYARNRGAEGASGDWLLFLDADVYPPPNLVERYFHVDAEDGTGVLAGGVVDEPVDPAADGSPAARYARLRDRMGQGNTLRDGEWSYAQTANCAVRRTAFEQVNGFRDDVRSGGDADLCFRLRRAGWGIEERSAAQVVHRSRRTVRSMLRQRARHGSGAAWLEREYPGSFPRVRLAGLAKWTVRSFARAPVAAARRRADDALFAVLDPLDNWAFELGRLFSNTVRHR